MLLRLAFLFFRTSDKRLFQITQQTQYPVRCLYFRFPEFGQHGIGLLLMFLCRTVKQILYGSQIHCSRGSPHMVSPAMVQADNGPWGQQATPAHGRCHGNVCRHRPVGTGPAWHRRARHPRRTVALLGRTGGERGSCLPCRKAYGHAHQGIRQ